MPFVFMALQSALSAEAQPSMPVNVLNLSGLRVLDLKETDTDYHVEAQPTIVSKLCPHCGRSNETVAHAQKTLFVRDLPSHGKSVAVRRSTPDFSFGQLDKVGIDRTGKAHAQGGGALRVEALGGLAAWLLAIVTPLILSKLRPVESRLPTSRQPSG